MEIYTIGGYSEIGKNMTLIKVNDEAIILDMGLHVERIVKYDEDEQETFTVEDMRRIGAIPNDKEVENLNVKAIVIGHAHLDHLGSVPYLANKYNCPIIGTPYTIEVLNAILRDKEFKLKNKVKKMNCNSSIKIGNFKIEFVNITHSTLQTVLVVLHTKDGNVVYANDFKLDNHPVVGKKPNYDRLKKIGEDGVKTLIVDSTRADEPGKTPSEKVAREMLRDVLLGIQNDESLVLVTTFSSHIARLKSIVDFGKIMNRKVVFLGRSLRKYVEAARKLNLIKFKDIEVIGFKSKIKKKLREIEKQGRDKYLVVCTGNQGEPKAVLSRLVNKDLPFRFLSGDSVIFSSSVIPTETNIRNREILERKLMMEKVRVFRDIHVSGHCCREDLRDLINILKPKNIIPAHGNSEKLNALANLAYDIGYKKRNVFVKKDNEKIVL